MTLPSSQHDSPSNEAWWTRFQELLDEQSEWPGDYTFKFIAPQTELNALKDIFGGHPVKVRASSKGNYVSVTARLHMYSSDDVITIYKSAREIEGVISL